MKNTEGMPSKGGEQPPKALFMQRLFAGDYINYMVCYDLYLDEVGDDYKRLSSCQYLFVVH